MYTDVLVKNINNKEFEQHWTDRKSAEARDSMTDACYFVAKAHCFTYLFRIPNNLLNALS